MIESSIGLIDRVYYDERNDRTKAFFTTLLTSVNDVRRCQEMFLQEARGKRFSLRLAVRGVDNIRLDTLTFPHAGQMMTCEAIIPVDVDVLGTKIVYYGWNDAVRTTNREHRIEEAKLLRKVLERNGTSEHDRSSFMVDFSKQKTDWDRRDILRLLDIYKCTFSGYLFDFTFESVRSMLATNWVSLVRNCLTEEIVAVAMGEMARVKIGNEKMEICELSEVATHPDFQRRGLAHMAFGKLCHELNEAEARVVFSETRATSFGMMAVAHDNGFKPCGRLEKHCIISSPCSEVGQDGDYGDLMVFARQPQG